MDGIEAPRSRVAFLAIKETSGRFLLGEAESPPSFSPIMAGGRGTLVALQKQKSVGGGRGDLHQNSQLGKNA